MTICKNCEENIQDDICYECGYITTEQIYDYSKPYENPINNTKYNTKTTYENISSNELTTIRLSEYIINFFKKIHIHLSSDVWEFCLNVLNIVKQVDSSKRAKTKDGILLYCYSLKEKSDISSLVKLTNINTKYINNAEKLISELVYLKKIKLDKEIFINNSCITSTTKLLNFQLPDIILEQMHNLKILCTNNNILNTNTPLSVNVCCILYILEINNIKLNKTISNIKHLGKLYKISNVTLQKTKKILLKYISLFEQNGIIKVTNQI